MVRNPFFSRFRVIKIFAFQTDIQTDQGTHPLIESLRQRLKMNPAHQGYSAKDSLLLDESKMLATSGGRTLSSEFTQVPFTESTRKITPLTAN